MSASFRVPRWTVIAFVAAGLVLTFSAPGAAIAAPRDAAPVTARATRAAHPDHTAHRRRHAHATWRERARASARALARPEGGRRAPAARRIAPPRVVARRARGPASPAPRPRARSAHARLVAAAVLVVPASPSALPADFDRLPDSRTRDPLEHPPPSSDSALA